MPRIETENPEQEGDVHALLRRVQHRQVDLTISEVTDSKVPDCRRKKQCLIVTFHWTPTEA
jgi:hypothetical protein